MYKKSIITGVLCATLSLATAIGASAGTVKWTTKYGTATGSSSTYTWSQGGSPTYRKTSAVTRNSKTAPKIAAEVYGYAPSGKEVISVAKKTSNAASLSAVHNSEEYAKLTITGHGIHAVWSNTVKRVNYKSTFN